MTPNSFWLTAAAASATLVASSFGPLPAAEDAPRPMPAVDVSDFTNIEASSLADFTGNAVLLEFFAHW